LSPENDKYGAIDGSRKDLKTDDAGSPTRKGEGTGVVVKAVKPTEAPDGAVRQRA